MTPLVLIASAALASTPTASPSPTPSPDTATVVNLYTDNADTRGVRAKTVGNGEKVTIHVYKDPNETCDVDTKREELKEPPNAIALALNALRAAFTTAGARAKTCLPCAATGALKNRFVAAEEQANATMARLQGAITDVEARLITARELMTCLSDADTAVPKSEDLPKSSESVFGTPTGKVPQPDVTTGCLEDQRACVPSNPTESEAPLGEDHKGSLPFPPAHGAEQCQDAQTYTSAIEAAIAASMATLDSTVSSLRGDEAAFAHLQDAVKAASQEGSLCTEDVTALYTGVSCIGRLIDQSKAAQARLQVARDALAAFVTTARAVRVWTTEQDLLLPLDSNSKVTATATCKSIFTGQPTIKPVTVVVTYQDESMFSASAGVLVSTVDKRKLGLAAVRSDGAGGFVNMFSTVDHADSQILPFTFLTLRLKNFTPKAFLGFSGGVGINGSSGSRQVEYFYGLTVGYAKFDFHLGVHQGRLVELGGGFQLDTPAPEKLSAAPVRYVPERGLAIAVAYRLPLP